MKRTELKRKTPLRNTRPLARHVAVRRVNHARIRAHRARDFGTAAEVVRAQPCCVCVRWDMKQTGMTEAHHEPPRSVGGRSGDLVPLCTKCHRRRHQLGATSFWNEAGMPWQPVVERMRALVAQGAVT